MADVLRRRPDPEDTVTGPAVTAVSGSYPAAETRHGAALQQRGIEQRAEYLDIQQGAWCGMHALNNLMGGPYIDKDSCR
eukprot:6125916-Karenia_brevis.AAC.1